MIGFTLQVRSYVVAAFSNTMASQVTHVVLYFLHLDESSLPSITLLVRAPGMVRLGGVLCFSYG